MMARPIGVLVAGRPELTGANAQFPHLSLGGGRGVIHLLPSGQLRPAAARCGECAPGAEMLMLK